MQKHEDSKSRKRKRSDQVHANTKFKQLALQFYSWYRHDIINVLIHGIQVDDMDWRAF